MARFLINPQAAPILSIAPYMPSRLAPVSTLSDDLIRKIFRLLSDCAVTQIPQRTCNVPTSLTLVCSRWRRIAYEVLELWRSITIIGKPSMAQPNSSLGPLIDAWQDLGGLEGDGRTLRVELPAWSLPDRVESDGLLDRLVLPRLGHRIQHLEIRAMARDIQSVLTLPEGKLPGLTSLTLDCLDPLHIIDLPDITFKAAPRLHTVFLSSPGTSWAKIYPALPLPWSQLRVLEISKSVMPLSACIQFLGQSPKLERFSVALTGGGHSKGPGRKKRGSETIIYPPLKPLIALPQLTSLSLTLYNHAISENTEWLFPIALPRLQHLELASLHRDKNSRTIWPHKTIVEFLPQVSGTLESLSLGWEIEETQLEEVVHALPVLARLSTPMVDPKWLERRSSRGSTDVPTKNSFDSLGGATLVDQAEKKKHKKFLSAWGWP